ncbi:hypothetical protein PAHAL_8G101100 [Panicum hallii]|jgi:hypothetical protein|uniref:Uncharacterized protein n=1 Tax=Panicum hallii TaxID=206008 RepID=A0A2S3IDL2_9POAL|nr:hypothetical protein PAHAL_8G101100 [Panicum hallii]
MTSFRSEASYLNHFMGSISYNLCRVIINIQLLATQTTSCFSCQKKVFPYVQIKRELTSQKLKWLLKVTINIGYLCVHLLIMRNAGLCDYLQEGMLEAISI